MIFSENFLNCPSCETIYEEPRILPCGETICSKCIPNTETEFDCVYCFAKHQSDSNFHPINKALAIAIESSINSNYLRCKYENFIKEKSSIELEYKNIISSLENPETSISDHCKLVINSIDLDCEDKIKTIQNERDTLIQKVVKYERNCLDQLKNNKEKIKTLSDKVKDLIKEYQLNSIGILESPQNEDPKEKLVKKHTLKSQISIEYNRFKILIFNSQILKYEKNTNKLEQDDFLGIIKLHEYQNINSEYLIKSPLIQDCSYSKIQLRHFYSNLFIFATTRLRNPANLTYELNIQTFDSKQCHNKRLFSLEKSRSKFLLKTYENFAYLWIDHPKNLIIKLTNRLNILNKSSTLETFDELLPTDKYILLYRLCIYQRRDILKVYDKNLILIMLLNNTQNPLIYYPSQIREMYLNESFYLFRTEELMYYVDRKTGEFVKSFELSLDLKVIKVTDENVIFVCQSKKDKILLIDFDGMIVEEIKLEGFSPKTLIYSSCIDNFEFIDTTSLAFYTY
ncbi:unnamed protein product [Brachionus calyciflorus]|uniref:RING-type domain-containing protein n=1 Tax=Brachionus calyciflorus TaxID=104777 RepID=A0A813RH66_9BILA|nr:unnamed protein product [Brachionus calyciflorus]